jgi:hypothetical protein
MILTLLTCTAAAVAVAYLGGLERDGRFHPELLLNNPGQSLFFLGPYLALGGAALASRSHRATSVAVLVVTLVLAVIAVLGVHADHQVHVATQPGREVTPMAGFAATLLWLGAVGMLVVAGIGWLVRAAKPR